MKKWVLLIIFGLLGAWSCSKDSEGLNKAATWEVPGSESIVEFYYLKGTMEEQDLKFKVREIAENLSSQHSVVQVFVFYDKGFARKMDSEKVKRDFYEKGMGPGIMLLSDPGQKVQGGALMILSKDHPEPEWYYQPPL